jgi:hypothetical protein
MTAQRKAELSRYLELIATELDITDTQYRQAKTHYGAVGKWLDDKDSPLKRYSPKIYAQGSIALGTVVKPIGREEFDIDLVCELALAQSSPPQAVFNAVGQRMKQHKDYARKLTPKNRCWRLDYAEAFHMDIIPAIPDARRGVPNLLVPDRELSRWKETCPDGYKAWFGQQMEVYQRRAAGLQVAARVAPLPAEAKKIKTPLQRVVQLLKRQRDVRFGEDDDKPISIVITTLAARAYENEEDIFDALSNICAGMPLQLDREPDGYPACYNPTNREENFGDKWRKHPERLEALRLWLTELQTGLSIVLTGTGGIPVVTKRLAILFGEQVVKRAFSRAAEQTQLARKQSRLRVASAGGVLGTAGARIVRNTFYGSR